MMIDIAKQKFSELRWALLVPPGLVVIALASWIIVHSVIWLVESHLAPIIAGIVAFLVVSFTLPSLAVLALVAVIIRLLELEWYASVVILILATWMASNFGIAWSRDWPEKWKHSEQFAIIRFWQWQVWFESRLLGYGCPSSAILVVLYTLWQTLINSP